MQRATITLHNGPLAFTAVDARPDPGGDQAGLVVCLHGFPDTNASYDAQLAALTGAGYRVIVPLLRGYEPSSQPADGRYHLVDIADDVIAWLDQLDAAKAHIIGHDWGAPIGYLLAARTPDRVASLTAMAVAPTSGLSGAIARYPRQKKLSWYMSFFQIPVVSDWWVARRRWAFLERLWRDWSPTWDIPPAKLEELKRVFDQPGVGRAALGYYRAFLRPGGGAPRAETRRLLGQPTPVPTLLIGGEDDGCMMAELYDVAVRPEMFPAGVAVHRIPGAGHFVHQEQPDAVNPLILAFLAAHPIAA